MFSHKNLHIFTTEKKDGSFSSIGDYQEFCQKKSGMASCEQVIFEMNQTHSNSFASILSPNDISSTLRKIPETDGIITNQKHITLLIKTADCIPLILFNQDTSIVAVAHVGWRGLVGKIHTKIVNELTEKHSIKVRDLYAWIGPSIRSCCYSFEDKPIQVDDIAWKKHIAKDGKEWHIDLAGYLKKSLLNLGVLGKNILDDGECTYHNKEKYLSYLRHKNEGDLSGNMLTVVQLS